MYTAHSSLACLSGAPKARAGPGQGGGKTLASASLHGGASAFQGMHVHSPSLQKGMGRRELGTESRLLGPRPRQKQSGGGTLSTAACQSLLLVPSLILA